MKILVDDAKCIGSGMCMAAAPQVFRLDEARMKVELLKDEASEAERAAVEDAVVCCPVEAIATAVED